MVLYCQSCFMNSQPWACGERVIRRSVPSLPVLRVTVGSHDVGASSCRGLYGCFLFHFGLLCSICYWVLPGPPVEQHQPLLEGQSRFIEKCPTLQTHRLFTCVDWTSPPAVQHHNTYDECSPQSLSAVLIFI